MTGTGSPAEPPGAVPGQPSPGQPADPAWRKLGAEPGLCGACPARQAERDAPRDGVCALHPGRVGYPAAALPGSPRRRLRRIRAALSWWPALIGERKLLDVEQRSGVTVLRLRHGKVNALDVDLLRAITVAMREAPPDAAVVITGAGNAFSAGVDLKRIVDGGHSYVREFLPLLSAAFMAVFDHPGPVVAAINGHAIAGGCVLAAACDLRLMSRGTIGLAELSVGVPFPQAAVEILRYAIRQAGLPAGAHGRAAGSVPGAFGRAGP